jgi:methylmalonyl-CoA mutase N-terminal domain/subunit
MSLNTQHIIAYESGAADVVDPMAGSYYVEALTNKVEEEGTRIYNEIQAMGGMIAALEQGYIQDMLSTEAAKKFREIDTKERLVVGVNHLVIPQEDDFEIPIQEVHTEDSAEIADRMAAWKPTRDQALLKSTLTQLYQDGKKGDRFNLMPSIVDAVKAYATAGEVMGTIRLARGLTYDPFDMITCPYAYE